METTQDPILKTCTACRVPKPYSQFHVNRRSPDGRFSHCKACCTVRSKAKYRAAKASRLPGTVNGQSPESRQRTVQTYNDSIVEELGDAYLRRKLVQATGVPSDEIPQAAIEAKRAQILVEREAQEQLAKVAPLMKATAELEDALALLKQGKISPQKALALSASARDGINTTLRNIATPKPAQSELEV